MRHRLARFRLNRFTSWRKATLRSLLRSLLTYEQIKTTKEKAYFTKSAADELIGLAQQDNLANRRRAFKILGDHRLVKLLFNDIAPRFKERKSGFTRILRLGSLRRGDGAELAILELIEIKKKERPEKKKKKPEMEASKEKDISPAQEKKDTKTPQELEKKPQAKTAIQEKPPTEKKPTKKFLGGLRNIFKKERDSL